MQLVAGIGVALLGTAAALLLRRQNGEYAMAVRLAAVILLGLFLLQAIQPALQQISSLLSLSGIEGDYADILLRALGTAFFTQFAADACQDAGEGALKNQVELIGRVAILLLALPLFGQVASIAAGLLGK